jgi:integrase
MAKALTQASVEKLRPVGKRRYIRDAASQALYLIIQPSGHKSWLMRFRRVGQDKVDKLFLGPVDVSGRRSSAEPEIGQPLTLVQARQLAARINSDRASGADVISHHKAEKYRRRVAVVEAVSNSFSAAAKDFIVEHAKQTRGWKETASNLGFDSDLELKSNGLAARWRDRDVKSINASDLFAVVEEARRISVPGIDARRDAPSESRARKIHAALSQMFGWLLRRRRVETNSMLSLHPPAVPKARDRVLSSGEIKLFWAAADALAEPYRGALKLLMLTGCRLNEIARLRWDEVGDDGATLTIGGDRTKNHLAFVVPLPKVARELIGAQPRDGQFVFSTTGGIAPIAVGSKIKVKLDAAMGDVKPWVVHDVRRTAATGMAAIGIAPHVVEAVLNHVSGFKASVAGTYNRHSYLEEKRSALERWADHVASIVSGKSGAVVPMRRKL